MFLFEEDNGLTSGASNIDKVTKGMQALNNATTITDASVLKLTQNLSRLAVPSSVISDTQKLQELSINLVRESMGQTKDVGDAVMNTMAKATFETLQFGVSLEENLILMKNINEVMGVNTLLSDEQVISMQLLAKNAGVTSSEIVTIVEGFASIGRGTEYAIEQISSMQKQARDYGINVGQFMKTIGSNMKLLSSYNFKDGVEGFSRMIAKAQALRMDVGKTFTMAEGLLDPEKAIETAAGFQMLGGAVGDLGDPFKLLHMAQTDAEGLQDSILGMAESAVVFNDKTGEFDIPVTEMYRLREAAKLTGQDYQELTQTAIKAAERTKKLDMLGSIGNFNEKDRELLANLGEIDTSGELTVSIPSLDEQGNTVTKLLKASQLGEEEMVKLREIQEKNSMSDRDISMAQLGALEKIANMNLASGALTVLAGAQTKEVMDVIEGAHAIGEQALEGLNRSFNSDEMADYGRALGNNIAHGFLDDEAREHFQSVAARMGQALLEEFENAPEEMKEKLKEGNILLGMDLEETLNLNIERLGNATEDIMDSITSLLPPEVVDQINSGAIVVNEFTDALILLGQSITGELIDDITSTRQETRQQTGQNPDLDDFISRPGMPLQSFNEDDIIIGGTNLFDERYSDSRNNLSSMVNSDINYANNMNGDVNLNVNGKIDLSVDGRNLPQNVSSEQIANEIVKNPNFTSQLMSIFTDKNNTYSV